MNEPQHTHMLLSSELVSDFHCSYVCKNQQHMCVCVHICKHMRQVNCTHPHRLIPQLHRQAFYRLLLRTMLWFLYINIMVFLFTSPQRSLVSSAQPPFCIRKERLYCPAHSWYLIYTKIWVLIPPPPYRLSLFLAHVFVCVCMYRHAHLLVTALLAAFPDLLCARREQYSSL